jgi:hypothetical protein
MSRHQASVEETDLGTGFRCKSVIQLGPCFVLAALARLSQSIKLLPTTDDCCRTLNMYASALCELIAVENKFEISEKQRRMLVAELLLSLRSAHWTHLDPSASKAI